MRPLLYFQDLGGTSFFLPILGRLPKKITKNCKLSFDKQSSFLENSIYADNYLNFSLIADNFSTIQWKQILIDDKTTHIICTLSSQLLNSSNHNLIDAANELNLPIMGIFDHWKGFDRLFDKKKNKVLSLSKVLVIDNEVKEKLILNGIPSSSVSIIGHPQLESINNMPIKASNISKDVLLVSQPDNLNKTFRSIFDLDFFQNRTLAEILLDICNKNGLSLKIRPHPKEIFKNDDRLREFRDFSSKEEVFLSEKIIIGLNSMFLLESYLAGNITIKLDLKEFHAYDTDKIPLKFGLNASTIAELEEFILDPPTIKSTITHKLFAGSSDRLISSIYNFLS